MGSRARLLELPTRAVLITGRVIALGPDSVRIADENGSGRTIAVPRRLNDEVKLEMWTSRRRTRDGFLIGLASGAFGGAALGWLGYRKCEPPNCDGWFTKRSDHTIVGSIGLGLVGSILGAFVGATTLTESWVGVDPEGGRQ